VLFDGIDRLGDRLYRRSGRREIDPNGIDQQFARKRCSIAAQSRREEQGLTLGKAVDDASHVGQKAHVEHAVRLVQHQKIYIREPRFALVEQIYQTAWSGDDDLGAAAESLDLGTHSDAAVDRRYANFGVHGQFAQVHGDLLRQLSGGCQDEDSSLAQRLGEQPLKRREAECGRFSATGLGGSQDVAAGKGRRYRQALNRGCLGVAELFDSL